MEDIYHFDPNPELSEHYRVKYFITLRAKPSTGALVVFFSEFSTEKLSPRGNKIFNQLVRNLEKGFDKNELESGTDINRYMDLMAIFGE